MTLKQSFPDLDELLGTLGAAGLELGGTDATEGAAGNISMVIGAGLREYRIVVWSKHSVMARSDLSVTRAADRIEYAETAAMYEYMNLVSGNRAEGLTVDELREVVLAFNV